MRKENLKPRVQCSSNSSYISYPYAVPIESSTIDIHQPHQLSGDRMSGMTYSSLSCCCSWANKPKDHCWESVVVPLWGAIVLASSFAVWPLVDGCLTGSRWWVDIKPSIGGTWNFTKCDTNGKVVGPKLARQPEHKDHKVASNITSIHVLLLTELRWSAFTMENTWEHCSGSTLLLKAIGDGMTWLELRNLRNLHLKGKHAIPCGHQKPFDSSLKVSGFILKQKMSATNMNKSGDEKDLSYSMTCCAQPPGWQSQLLSANDLGIVCDQSSGWRGQQPQQLLQQQMHHLDHQRYGCYGWCLDDNQIKYHAFQLELISFSFKNAATFLSRWIKNNMPAWI